MSKVILAAHGTRHAPGRECVEHVRALLADRLGEQVALGWVDVVEPHVDTLVADHDRIVPAFLGEGFHVRHDIAEAASKGVDVRVSEHLGTDARILDALDARVREAGGPWPLTLLAWAGSRSEPSRTETQAVADTMSARWGVPVRTVTPKTLDDALSGLGERRDAAGFACWLLAPGLFSERFAAQGLPCSAPLGEHPHVIDALAHLVQGLYR